MRDGAISTSVRNSFMSLLVGFVFFNLYPQKVTSHLLGTRGNIFLAILLLEMKNRDLGTVFSKPLTCLVKGWEKLILDLFVLLHRV